MFRVKKVVLSKKTEHSAKTKKCVSKMCFKNGFEKECELKIVQKCVGLGFG